MYRAVHEQHVFFCLHNSGLILSCSDLCTHYLAALRTETWLAVSLLIAGQSSQVLGPRGGIALHCGIFDLVDLSDCTHLTSTLENIENVVEGLDEVAMCFGVPIVADASGRYGEKGKVNGSRSESSCAKA